MKTEHNTTDSIAHTSYSARFTLENLDIRGQVVRLDDAWRTLMQGRDYCADVTQYFGELACVAVMVGAGLKHPGRVTLQIQGNTAETNYAQHEAQHEAPQRARLVVVDCSHTLGLRGMVSVTSPDTSSTTTSQATLKSSTSKHTGGFADWVGAGTLAMTVANSDSGQMYQSIVPIAGLDVAECFEHYFDQSEQVPTHLWLAANANGAGALMLQKLPGADTRDADGWARVEMFASSVTAEELISEPVDSLLTKLFAEEDVRLYALQPVHSDCARDEQKVRNMLRSIGRVECEGTLAEYGEVIVKDDMCNQEYRYDAAAIAALFSDADDAAPGESAGQ